MEQRDYAELVSDLVFNALLLMLDAAVLLRLRSERRPRAVLALLAVSLFAALILTLVVQRGTFHLMRLDAWLLFVHGPLVLLLGAAILRRELKRLASGMALLGLLVVVVAIDAFVIEPHWLELSHQRIESSKISKPLRIAVVTDIQTDHVGAWEREVLTRVLEQEPDLIVMPGDYLQLSGPRREAEVEAFRKLLIELGFSAELGVFAVGGNTDDRDWPELFKGTGVQVAVSSVSASAGEIDVTGLELSDSFDPRLRFPRPSPERFHLVFGHGPDFALGEVDADLLIAGHTHGGQVRLPFIGPLITFSSVPRSWAAGLTELEGGRVLIVSRGIGMERGRAPRLRFLCRPELAIIDLVPSLS